MKGKWKRLLAAMLAASMIFGNAVPAYATESEPVIEVVEAETEVADETSEIENSDVPEETEFETVEETAEEETEETESETTEETTEEETETEPVEEGDFEEVLIQEVVSEVSTAKTYDTVEDYSEYYNLNADESGYLSIEFFDSENFTECLDSAIETIVELTENLSGTELANVDIMIDDYNGNIPAKLWNALASYMNKSGNVNGKIMFHFRSSKGMYNKWSFRTNFTTVESDIDVQATATVSEQGITVKFSNTTFPASSVRLFIQADSQDGSLEKYETAFGKNDGGIDLEIWNNGAKLDHSVKYFYDSTGDCTELRIDDVQTLSADTYGIKAEAGSESEIYIGTVEDKSIGKVLYISYEDVLSGTFSNSTIENALEARSENNESYAQIAIIYPAGFSTTIPANIWNYIARLSDTSMRPARFQFAGGNYVDWEWKPVCMRETSSPVALNGSFSVDAAELKGTLTLSDVDIIPADMVSLRISTSRGEGVTDYISGNKEDYSDIVTVFGTGFSDIEVYNNNSLVASGGYQQYGDDTGVNAVADFLINDVKEIGNGEYTVKPMPYMGEVNTEGDGDTLYIRHWEVTNSGKTFNNALILNALQARIDAGEDFAQVIISYPENYSTMIPKEIWNAVTTLMNNDEWSAGFLFDGGAVMDKNWYVAGMETATEDVVLDTDMTFGGEDILGTVTFTDTEDIPAENVHIRFCSFHWYDEENGEGGKEDYALFVNTLGTDNYSIDLYDANQELLEDTSARYEYYSNGPGNDSLEVCFDHINRYETGSYTFVKRFYAGDISWHENDQVRMTFDPWSAGKNGQNFTTQEIDQILGSVNEKFNQIEFMIPWSESNTIYAEWIEIAKDFLMPNHNGNSFVIFTFVNHNEGSSYQVWLTNPGLAKSDVTFNCTMSVDETTGNVKATIGKMALDAETVFIQYHGTEWRDGNFAQQLKNRFGGSWDRYYQMSDSKYPKVEAVYSIYGGWNGYERHFEIWNPDGFDDKTSYQFAFGLNSTYNGEIRGEGTSEKELFIDMNDFAVYGMEADDETVVNVIKNHADDEINWIVLENYTSRFISKEVWNAAVEILTGELQVIRIHIRDNEEGMDWWFENPTSVSQALPLTAEYNFGAKNEISFNYTNYPAANVACNYWTCNGDSGDTRVDEKHAAMRDAFGTSYTRLAVLDAEEKEVSGVEGEYNVYTGDNDYLDLNVNIWNINNLEANETYSLEAKEYMGDLHDGTLSINPWSAGKPEGFSLADVIRILQLRKDDTINEIEVAIPMSEENMIPMGFVNAALTQTNFVKEDGRRALKFHFVDSEERTDYEICIVNPEMFEQDVPVQVNLSINSDHIYVDVNELYIPLEETNSEVYIRCYEDPEFGIGQLIIEYFGIPNSEAYEFDSNVESISAKYFCDEQAHNSVIFEVYAGNTGFNQDYLEENNLVFEQRPYMGNTYIDDEGYYRLELKEYEANEAGFEFDDDAIVRALELRANEEDRFDVVHIEYNHEECIDNVAEGVWNAAVNLIDGEAEETRLEIHSCDDKGNGENWFFFNPDWTGYDLWLNNEVIIGGPGEHAQIRFENTWYPAEHAQLSIWADYGNEDSNYKALTAAFGADHGRFDLLGEDGFIPQDDGGNYYLNKDTDDEGNVQIHGFGFDVGNVNNLWTDYMYTLCNFAGYESEGCLFIDSWEAGKDGAAFTLGEIEEILKLRGDAEYEAIFVVQEESDQNKVDALIASKLSQRLADWTETTLIRYDFRHTDGSGVDILYLINPDRQSPLNGKNLVLDANFTWDADNNEAVVNIKGMDVNAEGVAVAFNPYYGDGAEKTDADKIRSAFGGMLYENYELKFTGGTENDNSETVKAYYQKQDEGVYLEVGYTEDIDKDKVYRITRAEYIGEVMDFMDGTEALLINAWNAGKDDERLSDEEIAAIVAERVNAGERFASVELLQPYTDENTISAAAAAELMKLLQAPGEDNKLEETYLSFTFVELDKKTTTVRLTNPAANPLGSSSSVILDADLFTQYVDLDEDEIAETEKPMVSIGSISLDAENVIVGITELESDESSDYQAVYDYYGGADGFTYNLVEVSDENVKASYMPNWDQVCIEVSDTNGFGRDYEFELAEYFGNIHDLGEGREKLYINAWEAGYVDEPIPDEELRRILNHYYVDEGYETVPGRYFANIEIVQPYNEGANSISRMIASKAAGLLNPEDDSCLNYTYCYTDGSGAITSLILENPEERPFKTSTVNFKAELSFDTKGQPVVKVDSISAAAEKQMIYFDLSYDGYLAHELLWAFGGVNDHVYSVKTSDANATGTYIPMEHGVYLELAEPDGFNVGGSYTLTVQPYLGRISHVNGSKWLSLYHWEMIEEGIDLTNETQVVNALNKWKALGEKFDVIELYYESAPGTISYKVWNAARALLNSVTDGEIRIIYYEQGIENISVEKEAIWKFQGPKNASKNIEVSAEWYMEDDIISFGNVTFPAENASIGYQFVPGGEFDLGNGRIYKLYKDDQPVGNGLFYAEYSYVDDENRQWIYFGDICANGLEANVEYTIHRMTEYEGEIFIDANDKKALVIREADFFWYGIDIDADGYNIENVILNVIGERAGETFDNVFVDYVKSPDKVSATLWNAMVEKLSDNSENIIGLSMPRGDVKTDWLFINPEKVSEEVDVTSGFEFDNNEVKVNYTGRTFPSEDTVVVYCALSYNPAAGELIDIYNEYLDMKQADSMKLVADNAQETFAQLSKYAVDGGEEYELYIEDADALLGDKAYTFTPYEGLGSSWVIGNGDEVLTADQIEGIIEEANAYASMGSTFEEIVVIQKSSLYNTIKKELINALIPLLNWEAVENDSEYEVSLKFVFENDENDRLAWYLINPGTAAKDINANVIFDNTDGNGVLVKLNSNTYNAKEVRVGFEGNNTSATFDKIKTGLGEIDPAAQKIEKIESMIPDYNEVYNHYIYLAGLKKSAELQKDIQCVYFELKNGDYEFTVGSAQNLAPGTEYLFDQYLNKLDLIVGYDDKEFNMSENGMWKVLTPDTAILATKEGKMTLTPLNEGDVFLQRIYTDTNGNAQTELWHGVAEKRLAGIKLSKTTVELENNEFTELMVQSIPSVMNLNPEDVCWEINDEVDSANGVIAIERNGTKAQIRAIGEGEATVSVSYDGYSVECNVSVVPAFEPEVPGHVYALTNFDTKLSDIKDQLVIKDEDGNVIDVPYKWEWKAEKTSLTSYFGLTSQKFTAVCTEVLTAEQIADGVTPRTVERDIDVYMITIEGIEIVEVSNPGEGEPVPQLLTDGQTIRLDYKPIISVAGVTFGDLYDTFRQMILNDYFRGSSPQVIIKWTPPKNSDSIIEGDVLTFTADANKPGNKVFAATLVTAKNKTVAKDSVTVTVLKNDIADIEFIKEYSEYNSEQDVFIFRQPIENHFNLKFASSDTSVLKKLTVVSSKERYYGAIGGNVWETRVQCTEGNPGFANITVTAEDELKSKIVFGFKVIDEMPKFDAATYELNKAFGEYSVPVTIQFPDDAMPAWEPYIGVEEQYRNLFDIEYDSEDVQWYENEEGEYFVRKVDAKLVFMDEGAAAAKTYKNVIVEVDTANDIKEQKINVKVIDKAPKVTLKQTKNINVFYKDADYGEEDLRSGLLTISAPGLHVAYAEVYSEGFYTYEMEPGVYKLCTEHNDITKGTYKNIYVGYEVQNDQGAWYYNEAKITVKVDEKAPSLVLSQKDDTLYPNYGAYESNVRINDKTTGEQLILSEVTFVENRKNGLLTPIYSDETDITLAKNTFAVCAEIEESGWLNFRLQDGEWKNGTAKFTFDVKEESWNKPVSVSYSVKVNVAKPTLKLGSSKLTLNMNAEIANYQMATTTLKLNGFNGTNVINECNIQFVGADAKSTEILNNVLTLSYSENLGSIVAELHPNAGTLTKGTYKFKVNVTNEDNGYAETTTLTVSIVDTAVAKCVKLSKKGSIDVLRKDTTYITYTPKLTNLAGRIVEVDLVGVDEDKFDAYLNADGTAFDIYAENKEFSTKASYSIIPVIKLETDNGEYLDYYDVTLPAQTVKVTQGKPKATITAPNGNVLYTQHGGDLILDLDTVLDEENIEVENVSLANYTSDLKVAGCWTNESNGTTIYLRASDNGFNQINKTGKTWSLKFEVTYADKAVDQKPVTVTYKVTIK